MKLDDLIAQADAVIEKRASVTQEPPATDFSHDEDVVKLANFLMNDEVPSQEKVAQASPFEMNFIEKLACSVAMVEALENVDEFMKVAQFKETALQSGYTEEQVNEYIEKKALHIPNTVAIPAAAAGLAYFAGKQHGKKHGYDNALSDIQRAYTQPQP